VTNPNAAAVMLSLPRIPIMFGDPALRFFQSTTPAVREKQAPGPAAFGTILAARWQMVSKPPLYDSFLIGGAWQTSFRDPDAA
jgi:hypothetical protein